MLEKLKVSEDLHDAQNLSYALLTPVGHVINLSAPETGCGPSWACGIRAH